LKKIFYSPGEPSGIGVDLIIQLCVSTYWNNFKIPIICIGDKRLFEHRAKQLNKKIKIKSTVDNAHVAKNKRGLLQVIEVVKCRSVISGKLNSNNAAYVIENLNFGIMQAQASKKNALVTGPISKQNIIDSGIKFSGHTEWIQEKTKSKDVLMLLSAKQLRVALVTTHIPLAKVNKSITKKKVIAKSIILNEDLKL
jgi:4-hydroxythreonine-4-phosphate dehydrogenase